MSVSGFRSEVQYWRTGDVIRLSWLCDGKPVKVVLWAKSGKHYSAPRTVDKPTMAMLEALEGRKVSQAEAKELLAGKYKRLIPQLEAKE
jgi:hypothetical protein